MKKNILFVIPSLCAGGGEKSLINLLYQMNYDLYEVDLFLFSRKGIFINSIPREVNILELPMTYKIFSNNLVKSVTGFLKCRRVNLAYSRLRFAIKSRLVKNKAASEQFTWKYQSTALDTLEKEYDAAIGYLEKSSIYFVVDKVRAKKKVGWIHTNYSNSGMDYKFDSKYFNQLDNIVTVSEECERSLKYNFIDQGYKVRVIQNIVSSKIIKNLANKEVQNDFIYDKSFINIITIARLSYEKGIDIAIRSCKLLRDKGYKIKWGVLGEGSERIKLEKLIEVSGLKNNFYILGVKENPYPYIKNADIYVQPSRYEGKSIAIDEAKILCKPIVVTDFQTVKDQIEDKVNGIIVNMNEKGIALGIENIIKDNSLKSNLVNNLSQEKQENEEEVMKLYSLF